MKDLTFIETLRLEPCGRTTAESPRWLCEELLCGGSLCILRQLMHGCVARSLSTEMAALRMAAPQLMIRSPSSTSHWTSAPNACLAQVITAHLAYVRVRLLETFSASLPIELSTAFGNVERLIVVSFAWHRVPSERPQVSSLDQDD
ncbi:hypothetical protein IG631_11885 [Alternaria alternata]|jgi:hypothetical protein|nr:hypothetical protein IG631_11885 [Alternaria alternata]